MLSETEIIVLDEDDYERNVVKYEHALNRAVCELDNIIDDIERSSSRKVVYYSSSRIKTLPSLVEKCNRKGLTPDKIEDIAAAKIVVLFEDDIEKICKYLRVAFVVKQEEDYLSNPKNNGYSAVHMTVVVRTTVEQMQVQVPVEIQIKTALADALWSMEHVVNYKNSRPDPNAGTIITAAARNIKELDQSMIKFRDYEISGNNKKGED